MVHTWEASRLFSLTKDFAKERKYSPLASRSSHQVMPAPDALVSGEMTGTKTMLRALAILPIAASMPSSGV